MKRLCLANRRGVILIGVFTCLMALIFIQTAMIRSAVQERRQLRSEARLMQCEWLLSSALRRAISKVKKRSDYSGELWSISKKTLSGKAFVRIVVSRVANQPLARRVTVQAQYPLRPVFQATREKTWMIHLPAEKKP